MALLKVHDLLMRRGEQLIQEHISFELEPGTIFAILGTSGCGKSTLLRHLLGLLAPAGGQILYDGLDYWAADFKARLSLRAGFGVLFQSGALWSSMSVLDNVLLPLAQQDSLCATDREARARETLEWLGMAVFADYRPGDLSGGMTKRAGLARAIAPQPRLLFLDEPSAGLDPSSAKHLDKLILEIRQRTGCAIVMVSPIARGKPCSLRDGPAHPTVTAFLHRQEVATP